MENYVFELQKKKGTPFKILNLTDVQLHDGVTPALTLGVIEQLVKRTSPDLIVHPGDLIDDSPEYRIDKT